MQDKVKELGNAGETSLVHAMLFQAMAIVTTHPNYSNRTPYEVLDMLERQAADPEYGGVFLKESA